ncbi:unnamed protein product, partial [Hapterophycus canaliculatus]
MGGGVHGSSGSGSDSGHGRMDSAMESAQAVAAAREELGELRAEVEAARGEAPGERRRARVAQEQTSRLESLRSSAAAAASSARRDSDKARAEAGSLARGALEAARSRESEESRLRDRVACLRAEAARELEEQRARAAAAAAAAEREEERLADVRDSFGLEVECLQNGVRELEAEAAGWRDALEAARTRLAAEEERGRTEQLRVQAEVKRLAKEGDRAREEGEAWASRLEALRAQHDEEGDRRAREARDAAAELEALRSEAAGVRSELREGRAALGAVCAAAEDKASVVNGRENDAVCLERRAAELGAQVEGLEAARERAAREVEAARRRQAEELSRWEEAMSDRRREFERSSGLVRGNAASLSALEKEVGSRAGSER